MKFFSKRDEKCMVEDRRPDTELTIPSAVVAEVQIPPNSNGIRSKLLRAIHRDRSLIIACAILIILMNINVGRRYVLYPFVIFSTWVHELCHGLAALMMGGTIGKLQIFKDGSGLAFTSVSGDFKCGFVSSGGYPGTAVTGCLLLLFRRTTYGPKVGLIGMGLAMLLSCAMYVRNKFGLIVLSGEGVLLLLAAMLLPVLWRDNLYNFLAMTICLNAFMSIHRLFATSEGYVNGQEMQSDAHTVAEKWGGEYRQWAMVWLGVSLVATIVGIVCAPDTRPSVTGTLPTTRSCTSNATIANGFSVSSAGNANTSPATQTAHTNVLECPAPAGRPQFLAFTV